MAMLRSGMASLALWGLAGLLIILLCVSNAFYAGPSTAQRTPSGHRSRSVPHQQVAGVVHEVDVTTNPPPRDNAAPQIFSDLSADLSVSSFLAARDLHNPAVLAKRDGPLRCDDGPCIDGSCCSTGHICGYGPDYCGAGKCLSQCNATAMCGEYSENADLPCGMKLCCSAMGWCGTTEIFCGNADPLHGTLPCQAGYGSCAITPPPSCPYGGGSTNGRKVGYYQSWNVRDRLCNKVSPEQLNTTGYTHLFYSFASIDPVSYRVVPAHADDPALMRDFTALSRTRGLQTWIAIGGFDFSDPGTPTHTTWSDLCASKDRRAAFINSVRQYMDEYGFQGVDLDWEYPGAPERGGRKLADTRNFAQLLREMRAAYGTAYGISLTLAPDYWYLRWFDAKAMEPYVDFFGFMAYDLHGSWDADVLTLGKKVRGQADIREIANNTVPLWFDGLNPAKINFGLAMYGRGYTLADPTCNQLLCPFASASKPAPCTGSAGVMSLQEIQQLIVKRGLTPQYLPDCMMKQITWDDQWIGYDDEETFAAKKAWADSRCFGGTMVWSIDFQVAGSGGPPDEDYGEVVYVDSEVYQNPTAQCVPPCIMVFPPSTLPQGSSTTVTLQPYTATLQVGSSTTTVVATPPQRTLTVTVIEYFNYYVTTNQQPGQVMTLLPSFQAPPIPVVVTRPDGVTTTRTVSPPPLRQQPSGSPGPGGGDQETSTDPGDFGDLPPTRTPEPNWDDDDVFFTTGQDFITDPVVIGPPPPPPTSIPWPSGIIKPVIDPNEPVPEGGTRRPCRAWFFFVCISWTEFNININFWDIVLPPGTIGPGPPPLSIFNLPTGWSFGCRPPQNCLPPWPRITIGPGGQFVGEPPAPSACEPTTAMLTIESTSYGITTSRGTTRTTATRTMSREFPIVGCAVEDSATATTTEACETQQPRARAVAALDGASHDVPAKGDVIEVRETRPHLLAARACDPPDLVDAVVMPANFYGNFDALKAKLTLESSPNSGALRKLDSFNVIEAPAVGFTAYFYLTNVRQDWLQAQLLGKYGLAPDLLIVPEPPPPQPRPKVKRKTSAQGNDTADTSLLIRETKGLAKRLTSSYTSWTQSQICVPPFVDWSRPENGYRNHPLHVYKRHESECEGQYVYIVEEDVDVSHPSFANLRAAGRMETIQPQSYGLWRPFTVPDTTHGTQVASMVGGMHEGVCPNGKITLIRFLTGGSYYRWGKSQDGTYSHSVAFSLNRLEMLVLSLQDISSKTRRGKAVVNLSWKVGGNPSFLRCMAAVLTALDNLGTVIVAASGNDMENQDVNAKPLIVTYPQLFESQFPGISSQIPNLINVGATDQWSRAALFSRRGPGIVYAPGKQAYVATPGRGTQKTDGTSIASPVVAGLVAYFRALPMNRNLNLEDPANVKRLVRKMMRVIEHRLAARYPGGFVDPDNGNKLGPVVMSVWNGQLSSDVSCLVTPNAQGCPPIDLTDDRPIGELCRANAGGNKRSILEGRQAWSCPWQPPPEGEGPGNGGNQGPTKTVTYRSGTPSPTCRANCGTLCTDYWCRPTQIGQPPHFSDPANIPPTHNPPTFTGLPGLPELPPNSDWFPTSPEGATCVSSATLTSIGGPGGGAGQATITSSGCMSWSKFVPEPAPTGNLPNLPDNPSWFPTSPLGGTCVSSATLTSTGGPGGGGGQATITSSGCMSWRTPEPTPDPPSPPAQPQYPYTWFVYATSEGNGIGGWTDAEGFIIVDGAPSCADVANARTLASVDDASAGGGWHMVRCPGCKVCITCLDDPDWLDISVLEIHTPTTHVTWYRDRNGALVDTRDRVGGYCEIDTSDDFNSCYIGLGHKFGTRQLKCHAVFSADSIFG